MSKRNYSTTIIAASYALLFSMTNLHAEDIAYSTGDEMNLRVLAKANSRRICTFQKNDKVQIKWKEGNWYFVQTKDSETCQSKRGYMHKSIITFNTPVDSQNKEIINNHEEEQTIAATQDLRDEDEAHDHEHEDRLTNVPVPASRESVIEARMKALSLHDFNEKSFRYVVVNKAKLRSRPMSEEGDEVLCELKTSTRLNVGGGLTHLHSFVKVEDEKSQCNGTEGYISVETIAENNYRYIKGTNIRLRTSPDTTNKENIVCKLNNNIRVNLAQKHNDTWVKVIVADKTSQNCNREIGFLHASFLTNKKTRLSKGAVCGDPRIINVAVPHWGKQKIGKQWVAKWNSKFCPALRGMADKFGKVNIVSGVRPYRENKIRKGANCSKHRLRWNKNGVHVGCASGRDRGSLGGALDITLPGVWGNGGCGNKAAIRSQRKAYNFIRRYKSFRVNVYRSGRIHLGLLAHKGASRRPYSTCVR